MTTMYTLVSMRYKADSLTRIDLVHRELTFGIVANELLGDKGIDMARHLGGGGVETPS